MKNNAKSALILLATLLLGIMVGVLVHRASVRKHFVRLSEIRGQHGVEKMMLRKIDPTKEQRPKVTLILEENGAKIDSMRLRHRREVKEKMDAFIAELSPILTEEQLKRFTSRPPKHREPGERMRPFKTHVPREMMVEHLMLVLRPGSSVADTVKAIIEAQVDVPHRRGHQAAGGPEALTRELRMKLTPYVSAEQLDAMEHTMRPPPR